MTIGIVGRKAGMSRIFTDDGTSIPVTLIEATPNRITQVKTVDKDGYDAVQIAFGAQKESRMSAGEVGHLAVADDGIVGGHGVLPTLRCGRAACRGQTDRAAA